MGGLRMLKEIEAVNPKELSDKELKELLDDLSTIHAKFLWESTSRSQTINWRKIQTYEGGTNPND